MSRLSLGNTYHTRQAGRERRVCQSMVPELNAVTILLREILQRGKTRHYAQRLTLLDLLQNRTESIFFIIGLIREPEWGKPERLYYRISLTNAHLLLAGWAMGGDDQDVAACLPTRPGLSFPGARPARPFALRVPRRVGWYTDACVHLSSLKDVWGWLAAKQWTFYW